MKFKLIVLFVFSTLFASAEGITFFEGTWEEALAKANEEEKLIFVDAYAKWCGPCKKMAATTFKDGAVGEYFDAHFISMKIDMEESMGRTFGQSYSVSAYPTLFFIKPDGEIAKKSVGFKDVTKLMDIAKVASGNADFSAKYKAQYDDGARDFSTVLNYVKSLNKANKPSLKIANDFLNSNHAMSKDQMTEFLFEAVTEADSRIFDLCLDAKSSIVGKYGEDAFNEKLIKVARKTTEKAIENEYPSLIEEAVAKLKTYDKSLSEEYRLWSFLHYNSSYKDWDGVMKHYKSFKKKYTKGDEEANMNLVSLFAKHFPEKDEAKNLVVTNFKDALDINPTEKGYISLVQLLVKYGKKEEAVEVANAGKKKLEAKSISTAQLEGYINFLSNTIK